MNINTSKIDLKETQRTNSANNAQADSSVKFSDELNELKETAKEEKVSTNSKEATNEAISTTETENIKNNEKIPSTNETSEENKIEKKEKIKEEGAEFNTKINPITSSNNLTKEKNIDKNLYQNSVVNESSEEKLQDEVLNKAIDGLNNIVNKLNQSEEKNSSLIKNPEEISDNNQEGEELINNDFNVQENKDLLPQMNLNMNFSGGQPFSSFMNNEENQTSEKKLASSTQELAEEAAILSTMAENIAIANKNQILAKNENKDSKPVVEQEQIVSKKEIVLNKDGQVIMQKTTTEVKKKDITSASVKISSDNTVKFDTIIMKQADVEFFATLVDKGEINLNELTSKTASGATQISKTLADMLAKSMENNQPLRIDFDNDISVIIRISRDGKISADFLPSTQIAEAYLKENLPILKQRFDDNNIEYENLNHRSSKEREKDENKKKGRNNE